MVFRLLFIIIAVGIAVFIVSLLSKTLNSNACQNCNGKGYWNGLRGERNKCNLCDGTGTNKYE